MKAISTPRLDRLAAILVMMELALVLLYWIYILCGEPRCLGSVFDLDGEANLHSWFSSAQLLIIGVGFYCAALFQTERRPSRLFMNLMAGAAILLSVDETAQLHETISGLIGGRFTDWMPKLVVQHWMIAILALVVAGALVGRFLDDGLALWRAHRRECVFFLVGMAIVIAGGSGLEAAGHLWLEKGTVAYKVEVTVEEFMEMFGETVALVAMLAFVRENMRSALSSAEKPAFQTGRPRKQ